MVEVLSGPEQSAIRIAQTEEVMRLQNPQLQLLYKLGVAQMIEQEVGIEIPPLVFEDDPNQPPTVDLERTRGMIKKIVISKNGLFTEGWSLNPIPQQTDNGLFDTTLRIKAYRITNQQVKRLATRDVQSVSITFTKERHLQVVGEETTLDADLTTINEKRLAQVQAGIKDAFSNPRIERESVKGWYLE